MSDERPDPQLNPDRSPGQELDIDSLSELDVDREITLGEADPAEFSASDTAPLAEAPSRALYTLLKAGGIVERRRAALALSERAGNDRTLAALERAVRRDADADVRQFAVESLGTFGEPTSLGAVRAALADENPWVRAEAVVALDGIGGTASSFEAALSDEHYAVRRNAAIALFKRRGDAMVEVLIEQAADSSDRVREWAAQLLGEVDDERTRKELERLAREDDHDIVRTTARRALDGETSVSGLDEGESVGDDPLNETPDL